MLLFEQIFFRAEISSGSNLAIAAKSAIFIIANTQLFIYRENAYHRNIVVGTAPQSFADKAVVGLPGIAAD